MHGSRQLVFPITQEKLKTKMLLLLISATHSDGNILLRLVTDLSLKRQPRLEVAPVMF